MVNDFRGKTVCYSGCFVTEVIDNLRDKPLSHALPSQVHAVNLKTANLFAMRSLVASPSSNLNLFKTSTLKPPKGVTKPQCLNENLQHKLE
jgi:hypothetical protein